MNTQIEDFISIKNNSGAENYNNIDISQWNVYGCKKYLRSYYYGLVKILIF